MSTPFCKKTGMTCIETTAGRDVSVKKAKRQAFCIKV